MRDDSSSERDAWVWAKESQGYTGTYEQWLAMDDAEREEYEAGAQGIGTA